MLDNNKKASELMIEKELMIVSDENFIESAVNHVFKKNPNEFDRFKNGELKLIGFFMGQIMKEVKGKADPKLIQEALKKRIGN